MDSSRVRFVGVSGCVVAIAIALLLLVQADAVAAGLNINPTTKMYGSSSAKYGDPLTQSFTLANTDAAQNLSSLTYTFTPASGSGLYFQESFPGAPVVINGGQSLSFDLRLTVPEGLSSVDTGFDASSFTVGDIVVSGTDAISGALVTSGNAEIKMQVGSILSVARVEMDYQDTVSQINSGGTVHVVDGDDIDLIVHVANTHSNSSSAVPIDFQDGDVTIEVDAEDIEVSETETLSGVLQPGETQRETVSVEVDDRNEKGAVGVEIVVQGVDENGGLHASKFSFTIDVDAPPDEPEEETIDDFDGDGVLDNDDVCLNTPEGCAVDEFGCHQDDDGDGICNGVDSDTTTSQQPSNQQPQSQTLQNPVTQALQEQINQLQQQLQTSQNNGDGEHDGNDSSGEKTGGEGVVDALGPSFAPFLVGLLIGASLATIFFLMIR